MDGHASEVDVLLLEQARALEMIARGRPLPDVLHALCEIVERHGAARARVVLAPALDAGEPDVWQVPVRGAGDRLGLFCVGFAPPREPTPEDRRLLERLAQTAALAIERHQADERLRAQSRHERVLAELASITQPLVEAADVMSASARLLAEHLEVDRCAYAEVEDERVFVITGDYARGVPSIVGRWEVAAFGPACVRHMLDGEAYVVEDSETDPRVGPADVAAYRATNIRAVICVPLHKAGRFTAAMAVHQKTVRRWTEHEIALVTAVVARCWETLERARMTRTLRESEARYRAIVEATPECVKLVAADGTILQMNAAGVSMIEASGEDEVVGASIYDVVAPEHCERFRAFSERVCHGEGGSLSFEIVGRRGTRRSMETNAVPLPVPGGYVQLAVTRDVTARVEAERALAESRGRLDFAVRLSGVGFWYCDLPFDELEWDARVKQHFFMPADARVTIDDFYARIHEDDRYRTREAIDASIGDHGSYDEVYRTVDPRTGAIKWLRALGGASYAADGAPIRFDGVTLDVTAQKHDEERLGRVAAAAAVLHSSGTLEDVLRVVTDEAREIVGAHAGVASVADEEPSAPARYVSRSEPYRRSYDPDVIAAAVSDGRPAAFRPRSRLAVPLLGRSGARLGALELLDKQTGDFTLADEAILAQMAQLAAVAIENVRLYAALREQDHRKDEFLAILAHELRNPLAPIRTGLQLLQIGVGPEQSGKAYAMMERQLGHLVHMVDDLLDISRVTRGKIALKKERVDLRSVLESALESTRSLIDSHRHELSVHLPDGPLLLDVDPTRVSQVLANLLNNAAKYTPPGGRIALHAEAVGETLVVRIEDSGIGLPPEMVPYVFDMFTQVGRSIDRSQGGLGIGLTLVRRLVEMHGGKVEAASPGVGLGSTFTVKLPLARTEPTMTSPIDPKDDATTPLRILVVDDNVDAAETLAMLLELRGNKTHVAHNGPDALAAAAEFHPHVVFLDIGMPGMNGYEVARRVRADPALAQPRLIALTGWGSEDDRREAQAAGFDVHLVKPVDSRKISSALVDVHA